MNNKRVWASLGLVLIAVSIVCMLAGMFAGEAKGLMLNISLITFAAAAAVLVFLTVAKKRDEEPAGDKTDDE